MPPFDESPRIAVVAAGESSSRHLLELLADADSGFEVTAVGAPAATGGDDDAATALARASVILLADDQPGQLHGTYAAARAHTSAPIIVVAQQRLSSSLVDTVAQLGAFDLLDPDVDPPHARFAIDRALQLARPDAATAESDAREMPRVISVLAARGGAGATTIAVNLATAKARLWGRDVLLLDLDLDGADVALACGIDADRTIIDLVRSHGDVDWNRLRSYLVRHPAGFALLPGARWSGDSTQARPELLLDVIQAARGHADAVVADLPQSFEPATLAALDRSDALLLVLTPEVASIKHAAQALERLTRLGFPGDRIHPVLNRSNMPGALARRDIETALGRRIDASIPDDPSVPSSLNRGVPLLQLSPSSPAAWGIVSIAEQLGERHDPGMLERPRRRLLGWRRDARTTAPTAAGR